MFLSGFVRRSPAAHYGCSKANQVFRLFFWLFVFFVVIRLIIGGFSLQKWPTRKCIHRRWPKQSTQSAKSNLQEIGNVAGHLLNLSVVETLKITEKVTIIIGDEVDRDTLATEAARATDAVDVLLEVAREIVVDHERNLVNIDTTSEQVGGDENTRRARAELSQDDLALLLRDITVSRRDGEVTLAELLSQPVNSLAGVAENNGLGDAECVIQVAQSVQLPVLTLHVDVELTDTFEGKLVLLDQNTDGILHKTTGDVKSLQSHGGGEEANLHIRGESLEDIIDLVLETTRQHLIGLIKDENLNRVGLQRATAQHVVNTTRSADYAVDTVNQGLHVSLNTSSTNAGVALDAHVVTEGGDNLLDLLSQLASGGQNEGLALVLGVVKLLQDTNCEGGSFSGSRLSLSDDILTTKRKREGK